MQLRDIASLGAVVLVAITACGGVTKTPASANAYSLTLRIASPAAKDTNTGQPVAKWADELSRLSNGQITVDAHYGDLGGDSDLLKQLRQGAIDGLLVSTDTVSTLDPKFNLYGLPFLFADYKQAYAVADGAVGKQLLGELDQYGVKGLAYSDLGFRNFGSNPHPITDPSSLKGLKMRSLPGAIPTGMWTALGATPVSLQAAEIYPGLQQHAVDGLDMPVGYMVSAKLYEVVKYYTVSRHSFTCETFLFSESKWNSLTAAQRDVVARAAENAAIWSRKYDQGLEASGLDQLKQHGTEVSTLTSTAPFQQLMAPVYDQAAKLVGADLLKKAQDEANKAA